MALWTRDPVNLRKRKSVVRIKCSSATFIPRERVSSVQRARTRDAKHVYFLGGAATCPHRSNSCCNATGKDGAPVRVDAPLMGTDASSDPFCKASTTTIAAASANAPNISEDRPRAISAGDRRAPPLQEVWLATTCGKATRSAVCA
eukprot:scaffold72905_cov32-Tisochrysis_lutea.AAC.2